MKIAIVDKCPSSINYKDYFDFDFDHYHLCSSNKSKILKKDIDLDFEPEDYNYVITIGSEATKFIAKRNSVINFQGSLIDNKYIPLSNPAMFKFKPAGKPAFEKAIQNIHNYISGELVDLQLNLLGIENYNEAAAWLNKLEEDNPSHLAVDTETSAFYPRQGYVLGISLSYNDTEGVYINADIIDEEMSQQLQKIFTTTVCIFHNAKFDIHMLKYHFNFDFPYFEDTACMHYCLNEQPGTHGLKELTLLYTDIGDYERELDEWKKSYCKRTGTKVSEFTYDVIPFDIMYRYAATDAVATFTLYHIFRKYLYTDEKLVSVYENLLLEGTKALLLIEENGVPFNIDTLKEAQISLGKDIWELEEKLYNYPELASFEKLNGEKLNPNSPAQLIVLLYKILGLPITETTDTGNPSTNAEVLESLSEMHEIPALLLKIRKLKKVKSTYIDKILEGIDNDGRLRTNFNLIFTTSGRLSSSGKLNMQQLPRDNKIVKKCIAAKKGYKIVSQDLKTAEMWLAAALAQDDVLADFFRTGGDYHGFMAVTKFGLPCEPNEVAKLYPDKRQEAKTVSFEILYKLNLREPVLQKFKKLKAWLLKQKQSIESNGEIYQIFGRKRRLPDVFSDNGAVASHEVRSGVNALVQGPASDINLMACIDMVNWIESNKYSNEMKIFGMVHDSILAEVKEDLVPLYSEKLKEFTQKDRGIMLKDCPIGVDLEIGDDYAF